MRLKDLDENTTLLILKYLDPKDLISLQLTCKWGHAVASQNPLWKTLCIERYAIWNTHLLPPIQAGRDADADGMQYEVMGLHNISAMSEIAVDSL